MDRNIFFDVTKLYDSECCSLFSIITSGKKGTDGELYFRGSRSVLGTGKVVRSLDDGVVIQAGQDMDIHSRSHRRGISVTIKGREGVAIIYGRLASRSVKEGDVVHAGQPIGIEGSTGAGRGEYLSLEFRRNGRRIDGCDYLGIPHEPAKFTPKSTSPADAVCKAAGLNANIRAYIDKHPDAKSIWCRLFGALEPKGGEA